MENQNVHGGDQIKQTQKISTLSIIPFFILIFSYVIFGLSLMLEKLSFISVVSPLILAICNISSFVMSIIDLVKGRSKKWISIITLILSSLYFLFLILAIIFIILSTQN